jgi:pentatricopeptide repeat protein
MAVSEQRGLPQAYVQGALDIAEIDLRFRNQAAAGLRRVDTALKRYPLASLSPLDRPYVPLIRYYARAGRVDEATRLLGEYERTLPQGIRRGDPDRLGAEADLALARGRIADAIARYQAWHNEPECSNCFFVMPSAGLFELATAFERAQLPDSAVTQYERIVAAPGMGRVFGDALTLAATYKRLGELSEERGERTKALQYYGRFVDLWKDADPELQPVVKDVRARMARLAGEH